MLFIHQAPRSWPDHPRSNSASSSRPARSGDHRPASRGRRSTGGSSATPTAHAQRRPSSAVGSGGDARTAHGSQTAGRRTHTSEKVGASPARPGSANAGIGQFVALRQQSPPSSARSCGLHGPISVDPSTSCACASSSSANLGATAGAPGCSTEGSGMLPAARPVTPMSRHGTGPVRGTRSGQMSSSSAALPLQVTSAGRARASSGHRRSLTSSSSNAAHPSLEHGNAGATSSGAGSGSSGNVTAVAASGSGNGVAAVCTAHSGSCNSVQTAAPPTTEETSTPGNGGVTCISGSSSSISGSSRNEHGACQHAGTSCGNSGNNGNIGSNIAPTAASSSSNAGNFTTVISSALDYKRFLDRRKQMIQQQVESAQQASAAKHDDHSQADPNGTTVEGTHAADTVAPSTNIGTTACSSSTGWNPGVGGPVKASHTVAACTSHAGTSTEPPQPWTLPQADSSTATEQASRSRKTIPNATSVPQNGSKGLPSKDSAQDPSLSSTEGTQHLLRRVCVPPDRQSRAHTPTHLTQSSGCSGVAGHGGDSHDAASRSSRMSLPAGGARQACRSLRGELQSAASENAGVNVEANAEVGDTGGTKQKHRDSSVDGLLRDHGTDSRATTGSLSGNSLEDYSIGRQIGQGAYATVFSGLHKESSRKVAIKIYEKYKLLDPQRRKSVRSEIRLMERMRHPNIVMFHDAVETLKQIYIIMDFVGGGSLHHFLKKRPGRRLDDQLAKRLFFQVCQGIRYLHDRHIVHRDVKLENLLLDEAGAEDHGTVKIIDFGFSTIVPAGKKLNIFCGTPSYMAPEIVARKEYLGFCADIWAMGVLLFALLCGSFPFRGQNDRDLYRKIVRGVYHIPDIVSSGARALLGRILTTDMSRRPSVEDLLADGWFVAHRDDLYSVGKACSSSYLPNCSTSSTATTAAPSSSAGQSARDSSSSEPRLAEPTRGSNLGFTTAAPGTASTGGVQARNCSSSCTSTAGNAAVPAPCDLPIPSTSVQPAEQAAPDKSTVPGAADQADTCAAQNKEAVEGPANAERASRRIEEEAIQKLERLGYPRDEIVRQLKDESSHLCKLYNRFLKALTAWESKK